LPDHSPYFAVAHEALLALDEQRRIAAANHAAARLLGAPTAALVGQPLLDLVHPDDRARVEAAWADGAETTGRLRGSEGAYRDASLRCAPGAAPGELLVAARERADHDALRAERDEARRRLAAVFATMHDIVFTTDERGVLDGCNRPPPGLELGAILGAPMLAFAAPEEQAPMQARYAEVRERGRLVAYETLAIYPDGSRENFSSRMGPIMDGDRSVGVVLITRNVTQERRAEEAKRAAEQQSREYMLQLERSNRELERFASVASHDLQEPLRKIQAFSDRLREKFQVELPDTGRDYLERIRSAAKRMQDLINDLLMFSRLSAREQQYARVNLGKVARNVLSDLEVRIEETGGKVHLGELPNVDADPVHMRQLLQNLIGNALKFSRPDTPPVVHITGDMVDVDGAPTLRLVVADNGIGIDAKYHERIFGIFERLHGRGRYEGTGIGLAVCRKIVEQHHGSIQVSSVVGEGTTFTILLPIQQPERSQKP
jgi:PAS domain S-box-containing protein